MRYIFLLLVFIAGCSSGVDTQQWKKNPSYRAYIATRMAESVIEYQKNLDEEENVEELCDGSGWITHGDGHKTECPGCSACEASSGVQEIEWSTEPVLNAPRIFEEFKIPIDPEPESVEQEQTSKTKRKGPIRSLFNR